MLCFPVKVRHVDLRLHEICRTANRVKGIVSQLVMSFVSYAISCFYYPLVEFTNVAVTTFWVLMRDGCELISEFVVFVPNLCVTAV